MEIKTVQQAAQENNENRAHHPYSPSSLQSLEGCPLYKSRQAEHVRATIGTLAHGVTETRQDDNRLSDEDALAAAECLDFYDSVRMGFVAARDEAVHCRFLEITKGCPNVSDGDIAKAEREVEQIIEFTEDYLPVDDCLFTDPIMDLERGQQLLSDPVLDANGCVVAHGEPKFSRVNGTTAGYVDRGIISHDRKKAALLDWKFGLWAVEDCENNTQGIAYALGLMKKYPTLEQVTFYFKQPLLEVLDKAVFTREMLPALYLRIQTIVARAREARSSGTFDKANPMVPICSFCDHIGICPKVAGICLKVARKFSPVDVPDDITPSHLHNEATADLGLKLAFVVKTWAEAFKTQITNRVLEGRMPMPTGHVIQKRADREIVDVEIFKAIVMAEVGPDALEKATNYTLGAVEDCLSDKMPRGEKTGAITRLKNLLESSGAVKKKEPYVFLRAASAKKPKIEEAD